MATYDPEASVAVKVSLRPGAIVPMPPLETSQSGPDADERWLGPLRLQAEQPLAHSTRTALLAREQHLSGQCRAIERPERQRLRRRLALSSSCRRQWDIQR